MLSAYLTPRLFRLIDVQDRKEGEVAEKRNDLEEVDIYI